MQDFKMKTERFFFRSKRQTCQISAWIVIPHTDNQLEFIPMHSIMLWNNKPTLL